MTDEEKTAIVLLKELKGLYEATAEEYSFRGTLTLQFDENDSDAIETILKLIEKQEKIIDKMAKQLLNNTSNKEKELFEEKYCEFINSYNDTCWKTNSCKDCVKDYYYREAYYEDKKQK